MDGNAISFIRDEGELGLGAGQLYERVRLAMAARMRSSGARSEI
jgi:hypothetical protein